MYMLTDVTRSLRFVAVVPLLLAAVACGSTASPAAPPAGAPPSGHAHGGTPAADAPLRDGERFQEVRLDRPYRPVPPEGGTDEYRCFLIDPKLTEAGYLTGSQFFPQNTEIVHHGIFYQIAASDVAQAKKVDARTKGDGWQCFGGSGLDDDRSDYIGAWAPGHAETLIGDRTGYRVEAGSQLVLQVHYNLLATNGKPGPTDQSAMRLRLLPATANVTPLVGILLPGPIELPCTPAESGPLCDREAAIADLVKRTGAAAREPQPVRINAGDTIRVTCTHDATLRSKLPQLQTLKPRYVVWGDGTSDEMCLAILTGTTRV